MRTPFRSFIALSAVLTLIVLASPVQAQVQKPDLKTCITVGKGGVGESGASSLLVHKIEGNSPQVIVIRNAKSSLCGSTGAVAMLVVNGEPKAHGAITDPKSSIQVKAKPGDRIVAVVHTIPLFNGVVCVRLGELSVELDECGLVK